MKKAILFSLLFITNASLAQSSMDIYDRFLKYYEQEEITKARELAKLIVSQCEAEFRHGDFQGLSLLPMISFFYVKNGAEPDAIKSCRLFVSGTAARKSPRDSSLFQLEGRQLLYTTLLFQALRTKETELAQE